MSRVLTELLEEIHNGRLRISVFDEFDACRTSWKAF